LRRGYSLEQINGMFKPFEDILEKIFVNKEQRDEANELGITRNLPKGDALHAVLARDYQLKLITRDKHFRDLSDISKSYKLEEI